MAVTWKQGAWRQKFISMAARSMMSGEPPGSYLDFLGHYTMRPFREANPATAKLSPKQQRQLERDIEKRIQEIQKERRA